MFIVITAADEAQDGFAIMLCFSSDASHSEEPCAAASFQIHSSTSFSSLLKRKMKTCAAFLRIK
jgi:hypothetical protein